MTTYATLQTLINNRTSFAIQKQYFYDKEAVSVVYAANSFKIPYKVINNYKDFFKISNAIPVGNVNWISAILKDMNIDIKPDYYPTYLKPLITRKIWHTNEWPKQSGIFIKPADTYKRFTGFVTMGGYKKKKRGPYVCSEIISIENEWRLYVSGGKIISCQWYDGNDENAILTDALYYIEGLLPSTCYGALDVATLKISNRIELIEFQHPFACGWYGNINDYSYTRWLVNGWKSLTNYKE